MSVAAVWEINYCPLQGTSLSLYGCRLKESDDIVAIQLAMLAKLNPDEEYSMIIYSASTLHPPSWKCLYRLYFRIPYSYKKNLKHVYLVHGSGWLVFIRFLFEYRDTSFQWYQCLHRKNYQRRYLGCRAPKNSPCHHYLLDVYQQLSKFTMISLLLRRAANHFFHSPVIFSNGKVYLQW